MHTLDLDARDLRYFWLVAAALTGVAALFATSALNVLGCASVIVFCGLAAGYTARHRNSGLILISIGIGLMVPGWPALVLQGVNSL
ncbi:hypothetical protein CBI38_09600 [Rhodococcus oxybenzonivorans]|uniref:Uncharacterized protein n=1 Tax=Rhodococcus oxybenzonivorans TaxID=1990687 RepID=A0A2S2BT98_9NOCA|nr:MULTISPECIES: hypothetical protein [Rhodococcus]AWK71809.1 hypothetical protein CBI38_09600 [Rhodococcus oxybenzonivorans]QTJ65250.1 hypothetical protein HYG77_06300 [Rhodococcus sp. ZPP]